jgi:hypothetical protein
MSGLTLMEWLEQAQMNWRRGMCVQLATTGINPRNEALLAVGMLVPGKEPVYTYIRGGNPRRAAEYHGISFPEYSAKAVGIQRAQELLREQLAEVEFLLVNTQPFYEEWLQQDDSPLIVLGDFPVLGLLEYAKFLEMGDRLYPTTGEYLDSVSELVCANARCAPKQGYSMCSVYGRYTGRTLVNEGNLFEARLRELSELYQVLLLA